MHTAVVLMPSLLGAVATVYAVVVALRHAYARLKPRPRCCLDPLDAAGALALVRRMAAGTRSTDELMDRLLRAYCRFPPRADSVCALAAEQARLASTGGELEFATCTARAAMDLAGRWPGAVKPVAIKRARTGVTDRPCRARPRARTPT